MSLLGPANAVVVPVASANFAWRSEGDASYRITIADATGATFALEHIAQNSSVANQSEVKLSIEMKYELSFTD